MLKVALAGFGLVVLAATANSQQMTDAQKNAIRSSCRSDYMSNCMSVKPGGIEALQCLQKNMAKLSPACQTAVNAATPKAAPPPPAPAAMAPPPPPPAPPPAAAAPPPAPAAAAAIVHSPPPPAAMAKPARTKAASPPPVVEKPPQHAVAAPVPAPPPPSPPPEPVVPTAKIEKLSVGTRLDILKFCRGDQQAVCPTTKGGSGRIVACLAAHTPSLSPKCRQVLAKALQ